MLLRVVKTFRDLTKVSVVILHFNLKVISIFMHISLSIPIINELLLYLVIKYDHSSSIASQTDYEKVKSLTSMNNSVSQDELVH